LYCTCVRPHNYGSLCSGILTILQEGYRLDVLERAQRLATKLVLSLKSVPYRDKWLELDLGYSNCPLSVEI